jgi:hypothetical protein
MTVCQLASGLSGRGCETAEAKRTARKPWEVEDGLWERIEPLLPVVVRNIVEAHGIPLAATLTGGDRNDVIQLIPLLQAVPPIRGKRGRPRRRPKRLYPRGVSHPGLRHHLPAQTEDRIVIGRQPMRASLIWRLVCAATRGLTAA